MHNFLVNPNSSNYRTRSSSAIDGINLKEFQIFTTKHGFSLNKKNTPFHNAHSALIFPECSPEVTTHLIFSAKKSTPKSASVQDYANSYLSERIFGGLWKCIRRPCYVLIMAAIKRQLYPAAVRPKQI